MNVTPIKLPGMMDASPAKKQATSLSFSRTEDGLIPFLDNLSNEDPSGLVSVRVYQGRKDTEVWCDSLGAGIVRVPAPSGKHSLVFRINWKKEGLPSGDYRVEITRDGAIYNFFVRVV